METTTTKKASAPKKPALISDYRKLRRQLDLNQSEFWSRLGVTQSGGSRYESGRNIPASVRALTIMVFGAEQHARQQLEALRNPGSRKVNKPKQPTAPATPPSTLVAAGSAVSPTLF